jgi:uncharacterized protein with PIN domain
MPSANNKAVLKAIGSTRDFLSDKNSAELKFKLHPSVKDLIEAQGIPHTAVFKLEINGREQSFEYNVWDGDEITVYPFEYADIATTDRIFWQPTAFIADLHLGKLAKTLRLLGFDTSFNKNWDDNNIRRQSNQQQRMILSRDIELLKNGKTKFGYWVRSDDPDRQIKELFNRFSLADQINPFTRCMKCNGSLRDVELKKVEDRVPPKVKEWHSDFFQCSDCQQVYWEGSHYKKLKKKVDELIKISG